MVYIAELLTGETDLLKVVRIGARNVPYLHGAFMTTSEADNIINTSKHVPTLRSDAF